MAPSSQLAGLNAELRTVTGDVLVVEEAVG
jgi:hypothetical protein